MNPRGRVAWRDQLRALTHLIPYRRHDPIAHELLKRELLIGDEEEDLPGTRYAPVCIRRINAYHELPRSVRSYRDSRLGAFGDDGACCERPRRQVNLPRIAIDLIWLGTSARASGEGCRTAFGNTSEATYISLCMDLHERER